MAQSYLIIQTNKSIRDYGIEDVQQTQLIQEGVGLREGEARTQMTRVDSIIIDNEEVLKFKVSHDFKVKQQGRVFEQSFSYYFSPYEFCIYFLENNNLMFVNTKKVVANDFVNILQEQYPSLECTLFEIDLNRLTSRISNILTAWVNVTKQDVTVQSFHGPSVGDSDEVLSILRSGQGKYINFYYPYKDIQYYVGVSNESSLTAHIDSLDEVNRLIFLKTIYLDLIKNFVIR